MPLFRLDSVKVDIKKKPTLIEIVLPKGFPKGCAVADSDRGKLENCVTRSKGNTRAQIERIDEILRNGKGNLATGRCGMRCPGVGVLPFVKLAKSGSRSRYAILHVRGSNRGAVWPVGKSLANAFALKEFAGVTDSEEAIRNPGKAAIKELYEELTLVSGQEIILPNDIREPQYKSVLAQLETDRCRANAHYGFRLDFSRRRYREVTPEKLSGDPDTLVRVRIGKRVRREFSAVANFDPYTNALEFSFLTELDAGENELTGIASFAGPENRFLESKPYLEDIILVKESDLKAARLGEEMPAMHLLSVYATDNLTKAVKSASKSRAAPLLYFPSPTLRPIVSFLNKDYTFQSTLETAKEKLERLL